LIIKLTGSNHKIEQNNKNEKAVAKNFRPAADPLPGGVVRPKFNQLEMVTYTHSLVRIDACNFELPWKQTHKHTHPQTNKRTNPQTGPITIHCVIAS